MFLLLIAAVLGWYVADVTRQSPPLDALISYSPALTTQLYSQDGRLIAEYADERRRYINYDDIPDLVTQAFISAEDKEFFAHSGVHYPSILRAARQNIFALGSSNQLIGASTITQQMVKNVLVGSERTISRKVAEALLAWRVEEQLEKNRYSKFT